mmetsp:Transcript_18493/g.38447  ORF Transcript_18493/g.38447 Transcript_18493/m.38447 type:complete len:104 (-) Transcript_18493:324-635(-)
MSCRNLIHTADTMQQRAYGREERSVQLAKPNAIGAKKQDRLWTILAISPLLNFQEHRLHSYFVTERQCQSRDWRMDCCAYLQNRTESIEVSIYVLLRLWQHGH